MVQSCQCLLEQHLFHCEVVRYCWLMKKGLKESEIKYNGVSAETPHMRSHDYYLAIYYMNSKTLASAKFLSCPSSGVSERDSKKDLKQF